MTATAEGEHGMKHGHPGAVRGVLSEARPGHVHEQKKSMQEASRARRAVDGLYALLVSLGQMGTSLHTGLFWAARWTLAPMMGLDLG